MTLNSLPDNSSASPPRRDWLGIVLCVLAFGWIIVVSLVAQWGAWTTAPFLSQIAPNADLTRTTFNALVTATQAGLIALPLLPLAVWWRTRRSRAIFQTWLAAALVILLLAPTRLIPSVHSQLALLLQTIILLIVVWLIRTRWGESPRGVTASRAAQWIALTLGVILSFGWLRWGTLGSFLDVALGLLLAFTFGSAASWIIAAFWLRALESGTRGLGGTITVGGFVVGAALVELASGLGFNGLQPLLLLALPALGWMLMGQSYWGNADAPANNRGALALLIATVVAAPLLGIDPDVTTFEMFLTPGEMLTFAFSASSIAAVLALIIGLALFILRGWIVRWHGDRLAWGSAMVALVVGAAIYFVFGTPGFYGDHLFVILAAQADVSQAVSLTDYDARRTLVYRTLVEHANSTQAELRSLLNTLKIHYTPYYLENALDVTADEPFALMFTLRSDVERVLPSPHLRPLPEPQTPSTGDAAKPDAPQWNLTLIGADRVWNELGVRGSGIVIGQSDSGVQGDHPELAKGYRGRANGNEYNWYDPWDHTSSPNDIIGHGTHTLGSVLGKSVGVAPDAEWFGCVNLARNIGNPSFYLDCMQFMLAPFPFGGNPLSDGDPLRSAMVLNNSWGCPDFEGCDPNALITAVRDLRAAGIFVVASAGNDGPACSTIKEPIALYADTFSVGAVNSSRQIAEFSSRGPVISDGSGRVKPDIAAPGVDVLSALPGGTYGAASGTSMAGPHIVGVVALMWSANPKLIGNIARTEQILRETAQPAPNSVQGIVCGDPSAVPNDYAGYGVVDAYAAVQRAMQER